VAVCIEPPHRPARAFARERAGGDPGPRPAGQRLHNCRNIAWRSQELRVPRRGGREPEK
jgi:hypothetical protein